MSREASELFRKIGGLVCPSFLDRSNAGIDQTAHALDTHLVLGELYEQAQAFKNEHPKGVEVREEIPVKPGGGPGNIAYTYRQKAAAFIRRHTSMELPVDSVILSALYDSIISNCVRRK